MATEREHEVPEHRFQTKCVHVEVLGRAYARKPCRGQVEPAVHIQDGHARPETVELAAETGGHEALAGAINPGETHEQAAVDRGITAPPLNGGHERRQVHAGTPIAG